MGGADVISVDTLMHTPLLLVLRDPWSEFRYVLKAGIDKHDNAQDMGTATGLLAVTANGQVNEQTSLALPDGHPSMEDVTEQQHLLPAAVDYRAKHTPEKIYAALPKGDRLEDGFFDLTYTAFARAIDAAAWWLDSVLGAKSAKTKFEELATIPYVGPDEFRYVLFIHAAMKTGRKVMYPFPANTPEGLVRLLELSNSEVVLASVCHKHIWTEPLKLKPEIRPIEVPEICEFVHDKHVEPYLYERTMAEGIDDAQMLIQTSGFPGAFSGAHLDCLRGTWVRTLFGSKV
ncbi:hypothetical protein LTR35_018177 [Friedmanniomyces endolithicus]|nr:hypothetical protein LTR35_018177 [Friedmanniomyces endolithicus]KAK0268143.1 hypothetical protein LTS00_017646 [Friedmanniomyces endolithicus]KAK0971964.1 hypothetical protein LTR54_017683 [Friedmanniomyces endolithicus]